MNKIEHIKNLLSFVEDSTSQFHTIEVAKKQLLDAGFLELNWKDAWDLKKEGAYFMNHHGSAIFAFTIGKEFDGKDEFRLAAAHGDFPGFRIKPIPEVKKEGYAQLNVECYGGVNLTSWMDRPLSVAGRVALKSHDIFKPEVRLIDIKKPILTIPNIAIHYERDMNKGVEYNKQTHMVPLMSVGHEEISQDFFKEYLASYMSVNKEDILDYELNLYNTDTGVLVGAYEDFVSAPRLDNVTSIYALVNGIVTSRREKGINLMVVFDHEEVGSCSKQGAASSMLSMVLEKCYLSLGYSSLDYKNAIMDSLLMSVDVSHALHPNYVGKNDPTNKNILNKGFGIKEAASQAYATDCEAIGIVQQICEASDISYQKFVNRSDIVGGGTLGSIASAMLPVRTVDMGVPLLAMHSSRELMGKEDMNSLCEFIEKYFLI